MTFRKLTSATAIGAYASDLTNDDVISQKGHSYEDAASVDGQSVSGLDVNADSENGHSVMSVTSQSMERDEGLSEGIASHKTTAPGTPSEPEVVLKAADNGAMLGTIEEGAGLRYTSSFCVLQDDIANRMDS